MSDEIYGTTGWIGLERSMMDEPMFSNANLWHVYSYLAMRSRYSSSPKKIAIGGCVVTLEQGEVIFGRRSCAKDICMKESTVYAQIQKLIKMDAIEVRVISEKQKNVFSVIRVKNYKERFRPSSYKDKEFDEAAMFAQMDAEDKEFHAEMGITDE